MLLQKVLQSAQFSSQALEAQAGIPARLGYKKPRKRAGFSRTLWTCQSRGHSCFTAAQYPNHHDCTGCTPTKAQHEP